MHARFARLQGVLRSKHRERDSLTVFYEAQDERADIYFGPVDERPVRVDGSGALDFRQTP